MNIAIIGGGAAGFFTAINLAKMSPDANITIYEGSSRVLAKVGISGGGRCNLTNSFNEIKDLSSAYPRGANLIKRAFKLFDYKDTYRWFEEAGVRLVTQSDECVFPVSQDSQEIIDTLIKSSNALGVKLKVSHDISSVERCSDGGFKLSFVRGELSNVMCDVVVVATGGSPKLEGFDMFKSLPLTIVKPVPSLFTFNIPNDSVTELMGSVVENATVSLQGVKMRATGALLITHWGMSGPAILKLSSYAARVLEEKKYNANLSVNWVNERFEDKVMLELNNIIDQNSQKLIVNVRPYNLPNRLWVALIKKADISEDRRWAELGRKGLNRLINVLTNDEYVIGGNSRFRDEFVTCGGISLESIDLSTMESKDCENLYFAGEILDVDAITGGFNLQGAWSMGYVVAHSIAKK